MKIVLKPYKEVLRIPDNQGRTFSQSHSNFIHKTVEEVPFIALKQNPEDKSIFVSYLCSKPSCLIKVQQPTQ